MICPNCKNETDDSVCEACGTVLVSDPDAMMEALVEAASIPSLATLYREGKKRGLIEAAQDYQHQG